MSLKKALIIGPPSPTKHLTFYFDFVSPFSYLAYYTLRHAPLFESSQTLSIAYTPVFLGGIMRATGNRPPTTVANKREYTIHDLRRSAKRFGIPIVSPSKEKGDLGIVEGFPVNTLKVMRVFCAVMQCVGDSEGEGKAALLRVADEFYKEIWVDRKDITKPELTTEVLMRALHDKEKVVQVLHMSEMEEIKEILAANTQEAMDKRCFGLPYFIAKNDITGEEDMFWGFDHLGQVAEFLQLDWLESSGADEGQNWKKAFKALL